MLLNKRKNRQSAVVVLFGTLLVKNGSGFRERPLGTKDAQLDEGVAHTSGLTTQARAAADEFKVMTLNVEGFLHVEDTPSTAGIITHNILNTASFSIFGKAAMKYNIPAFQEAISREQPDILCLQEFRPGIFELERFLSKPNFLSGEKPRSLGGLLTQPGKNSYESVFFPTKNDRMYFYGPENQPNHEDPLAYRSNNHDGENHELSSTTEKADDDSCSRNFYYSPRRAYAKLETLANAVVYNTDRFKRVLTEKIVISDSENAEMIEGVYPYPETTRVAGVVLLEDLWRQGSGHHDDGSSSADIKDVNKVTNDDPRPKQVIAVVSTHFLGGRFEEAAALYNYASSGTDHRANQFERFMKRFTALINWYKSRNPGVVVSTIFAGDFNAMDKGAEEPFEWAAKNNQFLRGGLERLQADIKKKEMNQRTSINSVKDESHIQTQQQVELHDQGTISTLTDSIQSVSDETIAKYSQSVHRALEDAHFQKTTHNARAGDEKASTSDFSGCVDWIYFRNESAKTTDHQANKIDSEGSTKTAEFAGIKNIRFEIVPATHDTAWVGGMFTLTREWTDHHMVVTTFDYA